MRLSKPVADILIKSDQEEYEQYLQEDGTMIVELNKCLYGLRQSPREWYELASKSIIDLDFSDGTVSYVCLY